MSIDPIKLTVELVDIPSPTGEEARLGEHLVRLFETMGLECRKHPVDDERFNLLVTASEHPDVLLCTHLDTVPPFIASAEEGEWIRGRGACDAKGILASMVGAAAVLLDQGETRFGLLLLVGEEADSIGAKRANEELDVGSRFIVVGEPTESSFVKACKGAVTARVCFSGVAAHSAYPEWGDSAISRLAQAIVAIDGADWGEDDVLGRGTANVGLVRGGRKPNVIPDESELELMVRSVESHVRVERRIRSIVEPFGGEMTETFGGDPLSFHVPAGKEGTVVAFGTDAPYLQRFGRKVLFGPGSILDAHGSAEKIRKAEILGAVETYRDLVHELIGS